MKIVSYIRVSTKAQGESGLGLEAQQHAVNHFVNNGGHDLMAAFNEVESGKNNDRPELKKALAMCRESGATLLIAKLDRLSRNAAFLLTLQDSGVEFVCCDCPNADRFTVGILALVAQRERELISQRTREGLAAAKRRGTKLGNPRWQSTIPKMVQARKDGAVKFRAEILPAIMELKNRAGATSLTEISDCLNLRGLKTSTGKAFRPQTVFALL